MEASVSIQNSEIEELLSIFSKNVYKAKDSQNDSNIQRVMQRCLSLFSLDYKYSVISNANGELSTNYPSQLVLLEEEKCHDVQGNNLNGLKTDLSSLKLSDSNGSENRSSYCFSNNCSSIKVADLIRSSRVARCRCRFPIPVILYNKKHICRSATLSGGPEIYGRSSFDYFFSGGGGVDYKAALEPDPTDDDLMVPETQSDWQLFDRVRSQDIRLLKAFQVHTIVDLMVEKKKVKYGLNVTSSEKVDKNQRYDAFNLVSLPYPGCEFFKQYRDNDYNAERLVFEWDQTHVDANIFVPSDVTTAKLNLDWSQYKNWDLVHLTQNYLKLLLAYLNGGSSGLLIHCISGWDRTPLFVSLLRLSLWADGSIHKSLNAEQILFLTLAYDWLLFGHNLEDRLNKGEEILFFCFYFLKHIVDPEFSSYEEPKEELAEPVALSKMSKKARNDSDIHLDGVLLLDGEVSAEGSNWSLNSCSSSQSNKSLDNPPTYFFSDSVSNHDSWEDCNLHSAPHLATNEQNNKPATITATTSQLLLSAQCSNLSSASPLTSLHHSQPISSNGTNGQTHLHYQQQQCPNISPSSFKHPITHSFSSNPKSNGSPNGSATSSSCTTKKGTTSPQVMIGINHQNRTSPVAVPVPVPNRNFHHQNRTESNSSASIGSWQLITGIGSLRDTISTSDPGSTYSHTNDGLDCMESVTESSCTLVEGFTPINSKPNSSTTLNGGSRRDSKNVDDVRDDGVFLPTSFKQQIDDPHYFHTDPLSMPIPSPTERNGTPTNTMKTNNIAHPKMSSTKSMRAEKLESVRRHFYDLYSKSIQPSRNGVSESNSSGGGLKGIHELLTLVGIRNRV